ncbi:hypothetical protein BKA69DRAFT_810252 [Paraphysoderma sedebokerense]|nr:hypothetical protein BKA69DRAFT_810252 [Paraphysoderma sedebokerense]
MILGCVRVQNGVMTTASHENDFINLNTQSEIQTPGVIHCSFLSTQYRSFTVQFYCQVILFVIIRWGGKESKNQSLRNEIKPLIIQPLRIQNPVVHRRIQQRIQHCKGKSLNLRLRYLHHPLLVQHYHRNHITPHIQIYHPHILQIRQTRQNSDVIPSTRREHLRLKDTLHRLHLLRDQNTHIRLSNLHLVICRILSRLLRLRRCYRVVVILPCIGLEAI